MSFASKHSKNISFTFKNTSEVPYIKLADLYEAGNVSPEHAIMVRGFFIPKNNRYDGAVMVIDGANVNLPSHMVDEVKTIMHDVEDVEAINNGKVGAYVYKYVNKRGGESYSIAWVDF